jgi:hypothetical protein
LMIERINKPATRTWTPRRGLSVNIRTFNGPQNDGKEAQAANARAKNTSEIDELSSILDLSMPALVPSQAGGEKAALSPLEEEVEEAPAQRPVDPSRVNAQPIDSTSTDTVSPPKMGTISIFRDLSPR